MLPSYHVRLAALCLGLCLNLIMPAQQCGAQSAAPPASGGTASGTQQPVNLDLSSTSRSVAAPAAGTIHEGSTTRTIGVNDLITPAEQLALFQTMHGGSQAINLGASGNAVGGNFTVNSQIVSGAVSTLVVPQGVTGISTLATFQLTGNLTNYGSLYAVSTNPHNTTAYISAANIFNQQGALLTTVLPTAGLPGISGAIAGLNLSLTAMNNIVNAGTISSAGHLSAIAGGSIINSLPTGVTGIQPVIQAVNNLNLTSNIGNIVNSGLINSIAGNINITSQIANNLVLNNIGGRLQALNGALNIRDSAFAGKFDVSLFGGDIAAKTLNIFSGNGTVNLNVNQIDGLLNLTAGAAHVNANSPKLQLGTLTLSGDPTFYNQGNILLSGDISFPGQDLAIISGSDIIANGAQIINTSSANLGGQITMVAGAAFTTTGAGSALPPGGDTNSLVTITGGTIGGGKIDLSSTPIGTISSVGGSNSGGNITLVAYGGTRNGSGSVSIAKTATVTTGSGGTDINGNVTIIAGAASGTAIDVGNINTQGANNGTGNIYLLTSQALLSGCPSCTGTLKIVDGSIIQGAFNTNSNQYPATNGNILAGNLSSTGGSIQTLAGGTINVGSINTSGADANGRNGGIAVLAGANSGTSITAGDLTTSGGVGNSGNILVITSLPDITSTCLRCTLISRTANAAGSVQLQNATASGNVDLRVGGDLSALTLTSFGNGLAYGGTVGIQVDNAPGNNSTFTIGGAGADSVGRIVVQAGSAGGGSVALVGGGAGGINATNQSALQINHTLGQGSAIGINATAGALVVPGRWNVDGSSQGSGGVLNLAGQTINFTTPVHINADAVGTGNGGSVQISANQLSLPSGTAFVSAVGAGTAGSGGSVNIQSNGDLTMGAAGLTVHVDGVGTGDGGRINLASGGNVSLGSRSVLLSATSTGGQGGTINISGVGLDVGSSTFLASTHSDSLAGGSINLNATSVTTGSGAMDLRATSGAGAGGSIQFTANDVTTGGGHIRLDASSEQDFGGSINLSTNNVKLGTGRFVALARGATGGGFIAASLDSLTGNTDMVLNANGAGNKAGDGGVINVSTISQNSQLTIGDQAGQLSLAADGYSATGAGANGGSISVATGGNLTVTGTGLQVSTSAQNGNGGQLNLAAGTGGQGSLAVTGNIHADARGTGNGGTITLSYADSNAFTSTGSISARAQTGTGGTVTVSNTDTAGSPLNFVNNGQVIVSAGSGSDGSIIFLSQGTPDNPTQDVMVSGSGSLRGELNAVGRNVSIGVGSGPLNVASVKSMGGNISLRGPNINLASTSVLSSSGALTITTNSLANNGAIAATAPISIVGLGNLQVTGTGSLTGNDIDISSNAGSVNVQQDSINGSVSGSAAGGYRLSVNNGDLSVRNINAQSGDLSLLSNGGNLNILANANISSTQGNVLLHDTFATGVISFNDHSSVSAVADNGRGQIQVYVGPTPTRLVAGTKPPALTTNLRNGGRVYYGAGGITVQGAGDVANVDGSRITFSSGSLSGSSIVLGSNVTLTAKNVAAPVLANQNGNFVGNAGPGATGGGGAATGFNLGTLLPALLNPSQNVLLPPTFSNFLNSLPQQPAPGGNRIASADDAEHDGGYMPVAFIQPAANFAGKAFAQARCGQTDTAYIKEAGDARVLANSGKDLLLKRGEVFVAASKPTVVNAGQCVISLSPGSLAHVDAHDGTVKVRNLFDAGKGGIHVKLADGQHSVTVQLGQEIIVSHSGNVRASADRVGRRRVKETTLSNGQTISTSEYSLLSVIHDSEVLGDMFASQDAHEKAFVDKMMKMSVCLMTVTSSHGPFSTQR